MLGQSDDAWRHIDEALKAIGDTGETWCESDVYRTAGEIALLSSTPDVAKAEAHFVRALEIARSQDAKSWELRAATSLATLWRDQGERDKARQLLVPAYNWFAEGRETLDLTRAKLLVDELDRKHLTH
jgi:predicted ATPase